MDKSPDAFRTISEVADWLGIQAHVLRFWESKFTQVKPVKRAGGRRYYRPSDMLLLGGIKKLLHEDGLTIKGVQKILREQGVAHVSALSQSLDDMAVGGTARPRKAQTVVPVQSRLSDDEDDAGQIELALDPTEPDITSAASGPTPTFSSRAAQSQPPAPAPPPAEPSPDEPVDDSQEDAPPALPSFRRRSDAKPKPAVADAPAQTPPADPEPAAPAAPAARVVDAPDPPAEDDIAVDPGVLAALSGLHRLGATDAETIKPVLDALAAWHSAQLAQTAAQ